MVGCAIVLPLATESYFWLSRMVVSGASSSFPEFLQPEATSDYLLIRRLCGFRPNNNREVKALREQP
jgi:hypothetical protein